MKVRFRGQRTGLPLAVTAAFVVAGALSATGTPGTQVDSTSVAPNRCTESVTFHATNFPRSPRIDNQWLPLEPGTRLVLEGRADRGGGPLPHQVVFTVTDLVKVIDGVPNVVVWDRDIQDGELAEAELAFFAQDLDGNVWNLGEYPEEYEAGKLMGAPSTWFSGIADAHGGIHMKADPQRGTGWYLQGSVPSIEFLDCARVFRTDATACVPVGCFDRVLATYETSPLEPGSGIQVKYHARGVGIVQVAARGGTEGETLQLVKRRKLTARELATARTAALALERRGYRTNPIYQQTEPATRALR